MGFIEVFMKFLGRHSFLTEVLISIFTWPYKTLGSIFDKFRSSAVSVPVMDMKRGLHLFGLKGYSQRQLLEKDYFVIYSDQSQFLILNQIGKINTT